MPPEKDEARRWFYVREGRRLGPIETARLVDLVLGGEVSEDALVWHSGLPEWLRAREVDEIRRELPPPVPVAPPPPPPPPVPRDAGGEGPDAAVGPDGGSGGSESGARRDVPGESNGQRRRRKKRHRHRDSKRRPTWFWPLIVVLVALMIFLWWLLRRMNEVPPGRIIQTGSHLGRPAGEEAGFRAGLSDPYRVALGREPRVSSRVTSWPARFTTKDTFSPGFFSPSA